MPDCAPSRDLCLRRMALSLAMFALGRRLEQQSSQLCSGEPEQNCEQFSARHGFKFVTEAEEFLGLGISS
eukprot:318545-Rhodomonas_salina.3